MLNEQKLNDIISVPDGYYITDAILLTYSMSLVSLNQLLIQCGITDTYNKNSETIKSFPDHVICVMKDKQGIYDTDWYKAFYARLLNHDSNCRIKTIEGNTFHPKLYAFYYKNTDDGARKIRLIISSRNITSANYYEGAICIEGTPGTEEVPANAELVNLVNNVTGDNAGKNITQFVEEISKTDFSTCIQNFLCNDTSANYRFVTCFPDENKNNKRVIDLPFESYLKVRIISPFLGDGEFVYGNVEGKDYKVITRKEVLSTSLPEDEQKKKELCEHLKYINISRVNDHADKLEEQSGVDSNDETNLIPLHAKMYAFSDPNEEIPDSENSISKSCFYLGSANFSENGLSKNYELMIEITSDKTDFVDSLDSALDGKLGECEITESSDDEGRDEENFEKEGSDLDELIQTILGNVEEEELGKLGVYLFQKPFEGKYFIEDFIKECVNMDLNALKEMWGRAINYRYHVSHNPIMDPFLNEIIGNIEIRENES